jgi:iron-sulfur cluster repair protein YtfE (RIC family)
MPINKRSDPCNAGQARFQPNGLLSPNGLEQHIVTDTLMLDPVARTHHIEQHFHGRHREQFPQLIAWAEKVEAVHADQSNAPHGLAAALRRFFDEL